MFRLWGKIFKDNRMVRDTVICIEEEDTRTHKIFRALDEICYEFDLSKPIWLNHTIRCAYLSSMEKMGQHMKKYKEY